MSSGADIGRAAPRAPGADRTAGGAARRVYCFGVLYVLKVVSPLFLDLDHPLVVLVLVVLDEADRFLGAAHRVPVDALDDVAALDTVGRGRGVGFDLLDLDPVVAPGLGVAVLGEPHLVGEDVRVVVVDVLSVGRADLVHVRRISVVCSRRRAVALGAGHVDARVVAAHLGLVGEDGVAVQGHLAGLEELVLAAVVEGELHATGLDGVDLDVGEVPVEGVAHSLEGADLVRVAARRRRDARLRLVLEHDLALVRCLRVEEDHHDRDQPLHRDLGRLRLLRPGVSGLGLGAWACR